jgi:alanine racemase
MSEQDSPHWRRASVTINQSAIQHNLQRAREFAPGCQVMAVIKANAYGHGMLPTARLLSDADMFAVAMPEEAYALRADGCDKNIIVLHGFSNEQELRQFSAQGLSTVIHQQIQLQQLLDTDLDRPLDCWLKIDTGMHRLGVSPDVAESCLEALQDCENVKSLYVMSHFANADHPDNKLNINQIDNFIKVKNKFSFERSMANSAAIMRLPASHFDVIRPGIMLYGSSPFADVSASELELEPVMQFESVLIDIKTIPAGGSIGYGSLYTCEQDKTVGIVAAGYGDGYPRHADNGTPVWINGTCCNLLGRVSMDSLCVDLTGIEAVIGDRVVLWGKELSVDVVAVSCDTISYELLCNAGAH